MTQELWNILTKTTDWVKYSDTKAVVMLTVHGVLMTIVYTNADSVYNYIVENWITILLTVLIAISILTSMIFSFLVINPRLKNNNPKSIIYFGHIQEEYKTYTEYFASAKKVLKDEKRLNEQLSEQIHINSIVAWKKFSLITQSIRFFFIAITLLIFNLIFYFFCM